MGQPRRTFPEKPTAPRALILNAHPSAQSFNRALSDAWRDGAKEKGLHVESIDVHGLDFDPYRAGGYEVGDEKEHALEPDLVRVQNSIADAAHVVVAFPLWWGSTPAALKALFDRALLPGWAFGYVDGKSLPVPGLAGRSGRVLITMDAPVWIDAIINLGSARKQVAHATLRFCGLKPVRISAFGNIRHSTNAKREKMLAQARRTGERDAAKITHRFRHRVERTAAA